MSTGQKRIIAGVLALAALLVVGCGGGDDTSSDSASAPEDAVQAFYDASKSEDAAATCATLSTESQDIAAAGADSCEAAFEAAVSSGSSQVPDNLEIGDVQVDGDSATVKVTTDQGATTFDVVNEDGWKIDLTQSAGGSDSSAPTTATDATTG